MKSLRSILALLAFALPAAAQTFQPGKLPATSRDSFEVIYQGQPFGTFVTTLNRAGENFAFTGEVRLPQMQLMELDSVVFNATTLAPTRISNRMSMQGQSGATAITIAAGKATGIIQQPGPSGVQSIPVDAAVAAGVIGDGAEIALLPTVALSEGYSASFQTFDGKSGKTKTYELKVVGKESLSIPLGTFDTFKVQLLGDEAATVWVMTSDPHRIMMIRLEGQGVEMRRAK